MPTPVKYKSPFIPEKFFHVVCKSIDGVLLFRQPIDHDVFLQRFHKFTSMVLDVSSYSLLTNHTHYIVRIKSLRAVLNNITRLNEKTVAMCSLLLDIDNEILFDAVIERQMNSFLVSFANYTNNKYKRKGGLFQSPFRRLEIANDEHLQQAIIYTHANAQKHGLTRDFKKHKYNSYSEIISNDPTFIDKDSVLNFFGGRENFIKIHEAQVEQYYGQGGLSSKLE